MSIDTPVRTPMFLVGFLFRANDPNLSPSRPLFRPCSSASTVEEALQAVRSHFNAPAATQPLVADPRFVTYTAADGSILVEVTDNRSMFGSTLGVYKIVPVLIASPTPAA